MDPKDGPFYAKMEEIQNSCLFYFKSFFFLPEYEFYIFPIFIWGLKHLFSPKFFNFDFFSQNFSIWIDFL